MSRCALCGRDIPTDRESRHHLVPKLKGGAKGDTVLLHSSCHSKIHSVFTESELARSYDTIGKLISTPISAISSAGSRNDHPTSPHRAVAFAGEIAGNASISVFWSSELPKFEPIY